MGEEKFNSLKYVAKGASIYFLGIIIGSILGMVEQIFYGRILGPTDYGLFNLGITIILIAVPFTTFGLGSAIVQYIPHNKTLNKIEKIYSGIKFTFLFCLMFSMILSILLFILADIIANNIFHNHELGLVIKILSISLPFVTLYTWGTNIAQAFKKPRYTALFNNFLLKVVEIAVFFIILYVFGLKLGGALFGYLLGAVIVFLAYAYIIHNKIIPTLSGSKSINDSLVRKELIKIGLPLFFTGFTYLFIQYTDKILLGIYMNPAEVGIFTAAYSLASLSLFILPSFEYTFLPTVSEFFGKKDFEGINNIFKTVSKWVFILIMPLTVYLIIFSKDILNLIYGTSYSSGAFALIILSIGIAMNGLTGMTGNVLVGIRKTNYNLLSEVSGAITNVILNIILIPKFGLIGAAFGTSISITQKNFISLAFVYKELKIHPYNVSYLKITVLIILLFSVIILIFNTFISQYLYLIIIPIILFSYFPLLYKLKLLNKYDKQIINMILTELGLENIFLRMRRIFN